MNKLLVALIATLLLGLVGCTPGRDAYLEDVSGKATQDEVVTRLGPPTKERTLSTGETVWAYRYSGVEMGAGMGESWCHEYILTFSKQGVLKQWNRQRC